MAGGEGDLVSQKRYGALLSWIRGASTRAQNAHDQATPLSGVVSDAPSPLDSLSHGDVIGTLERELARLRGENRQLRADLEVRNLAYERLRETEERYRAAFHSAPVALMEADVVGTVTRCNRVAADLLGCTESELLGKPIWQLAEVPEARDLLRNLLVVHGRKHGDTSGAPVVVEVRRPDGSDVGIELALVTRHDEHGRVIGSLFSMANATERARREAELKASANAYHELFDGAPVMLLAVDAKTTTILECNAAVLEATGYTRAELLDRSIFDIYDPGCLDEAADAFRSFLHHGTSRDVKLRLRTKSGTTLPVVETSNAVADEHGAILACRIVWRELDLMPRQARRP